MTRRMMVGLAAGAVVLAGLVVVFGPGADLLREARQAEASGSAGAGLPIFEEDPSWPELPEGRPVGDIASIAVDQQGHVWLLHRPRTLPTDELAMAAPPVMEFDAAGTFVQAWGGAGEGFEWPEREHGMYVDHTGHVWIGGNNTRETTERGLKPVSDDQVLKFTRDGKFVMQLGRSNMSRGNADTMNLHQPADIFVYEKTNEAFIADGYANHRVIVFDADTGAFKRMWGAFGNEPLDVDRRPSAPFPGEHSEDANPPHFALVHAIRVSNNGLVYAADRGNRRIQVFTSDGKYLDQVFIHRETEGLTARSLAFSADPDQEFMYVGGTPEILVLDRKTLEIVDSIAPANPHHLAADGPGQHLFCRNVPGTRDTEICLQGAPPVKGR